jgi:hypothetical protein
MPTGYTAQIENGSVKTAKDFLRICLRNFGICHSILDSDVPLEETDLLPHIKKAFQKNVDFYEESLKTSLDEIARFNQLSDDDIYREWKNDLTKKRDNYMKFYAESLQKNKLYDKFLESIKNWKASHDFENIKKFAIDQLEISKDNDPEYWLENAIGLGETTRVEFELKKDEIRMKYLENLQWTVDYNKKRLDEVKKEMEDAISFYIRFEDDIKDII